MVGKTRVAGGGSRSSTPAPSWRMMPSSKSKLGGGGGGVESPNFDGGGGRSRPVSSRKMAATLWEMNEMPSPQNSETRRRRTTEKETARVREKSNRPVHTPASLPLPPHLSDPSHTPVSELKTQPNEQLKIPPKLLCSCCCRLSFKQSLSLEIEIEIEMAIDLPDELIVQILSILPAKSLLRCRSVCKSWLYLINSSKFKLTHLHSFNQLYPRYFVRRFDHMSNRQWFYVHFDDYAFSFDQNSQFPFYICNGVNLWFRIIGCCNGIVCLYDGGYRNNSYRVILWNPSIRRKLTLPSFYYIKKAFVFLGFGYDKMSDDYKAVSLAYNDYGFTGPHVEVYAVKTGIWREVMFPNDLRCIYVHYNWSQIFFSGSVHWIASDLADGVSHNSILTFDITSELFGEILLPDDLVKVELSTMMISVLGESLAVTYYNYLINMAGVTSSTYKIWVMKEYKNPTSWTLMYNMHYPDIDMGKPLQVRNKGDIWNQGVGK